MTKARARSRAKAKAAQKLTKRKDVETAKPGQTAGKFDPGTSTIRKAGSGFDGGNFAIAGRGAGRGR